MPINNSDGKFQVSYWRDSSKIENPPDESEYSDFVMELKDRIQKQLRRGVFAHAAIFRWDGQDWELLEEFARRE